MWKPAIAAILAFSAPADAQNLTALNSILVDACSRHEATMAEMSRGRGANSNDIAYFLVWTEINAYVTAYVQITGQFEGRFEALRHLVDECRENPSTTINQILFERWSHQNYAEQLAQSARVHELETQISELEELLARTLSDLITAQARIEQLEGE